VQKNCGFTQRIGGYVEHIRKAEGYATIIWAKDRYIN